MPRYELFSPTFGQVQTDDRQMESDAYEPTMQFAQVGLIKHIYFIFEESGTKAGLVGYLYGLAHLASNKSKGMLENLDRPGVGDAS